MAKKTGSKDVNIEANRIAMQAVKKQQASLRAEVHRLLEAANDERDSRNDLTIALNDFIGATCKALKALRRAGRDTLSCSEYREHKYTTTVPEPPKDRDGD